MVQGNPCSNWLGECRESIYDKGGRPLSELQTKIVEAQKGKDKTRVYKLIEKQRNVESIKDQMREVVKDKELSQSEKEQKLLKLQDRIRKIMNAS